MTTNLGALICFLQHSPVLEKLILQFPEIHENLLEEMGSSYDMKKQPLVLKDLTVEVKCHEVDERIRKILEVLCSYGLPHEKIKIEPLPTLIGSIFEDTWASGSFSFEQCSDSE
uniref:Uncharacterized protein n=1 Tax=Arundo donax TaxID=35708 RepID=A0A0A8ZH77_ARUDO